MQTGLGLLVIEGVPYCYSCTVLLFLYRARGRGLLHDVCYAPHKAQHLHTAGTSRHRLLAVPPHAIGPPVGGMRVTNIRQVDDIYSGEALAPAWPLPMVYLKGVFFSLDF